MSEPRSEKQEKQVTRKIVVADSMEGGDQVAITLGSKDGATVGQRYLIYTLGDEVTDPITNESLGKIEVPKGTGTIVHVMPRMSILESDKQMSGSARSLMHWMDPELFPSSQKAPFRNARRGDLVKRIF